MQYFRSYDVRHRDAAGSRTLVHLYQSRWVSMSSSRAIARASSNPRQRARAPRGGRPAAVPSQSRQEIQPAAVYALGSGSGDR